MEWTSIIVALVGALAGGGLVRLLTLGQTKKSMEIENSEKEDSRYLTLINELQDQIEKVNERLDKKDSLLQEKDDVISDLRCKLDETRTALVQAKMMRCSRLSCNDRKPPFGYSELTPDELLEEKQRLNIE